MCTIFVKVLQIKQTLDLHNFLNDCFFRKLGINARMYITRKPYLLSTNEDCSKSKPSHAKPNTLPFIVMSPPKQKEIYDNVT